MNIQYKDGEIDVEEEPVHIVIEDKNIIIHVNYEGVVIERFDPDDKEPLDAFWATYNDVVKPLELLREEEE